ncbi:MAG: hypothetical protein PF448_02895 [Bacteroidales bacterium]|jgi:hypothetical protein|nr:hypothetical protein [Bacteroidales bacterium]
MKLIKVTVLILSLFTSLLGHTQNTGPNNIDHIIFTQNGVDMSTGRYHKNLNILHVPGPGGGYTINLNYMSNLAYDQEASWVGAGWYLSPGSITRTLNGVPDDVKDARFLTCVDDEDALTTNDSHTLNFGYNHESWISPALQHVFGFNRALFGFQEKTFSDDLNQPVSFGTGPLYFRDIIPQGVLNDITITTPSGNTISLNDKRFKVFPYYFMDTYYCNYLPTGDYSIQNPSFKDYEIHGALNLLFPNYDEFHVNTANLKGTFGLKLFENGDLFGQGCQYEDINGNPDFRVNYCLDFETESGEEVPFYAVNDFEDKPEFFMLNEHAGYRSEEIATYNTEIHSFQDTGANPNNLPIDIQGLYNKSNDQENNLNITFNKKKATAYNIEYFINSELTDYSNTDNSSRGFVECNSLFDERSNDTNVDPSGIGAYTITDKNGLSYHFSLPVYQFEWFLKDKLLNQSENFISSLTKYSFKKFAYSWLLTAVTGPDYIDNPNSSNQYGTLGEEDSGYWVKFNYGKWSDGYIWQTEFTDELLINEINRQYLGRKQIYYLNSIETSTHIAYFIKSARNDALGQTLNENNSYTAYQDKTIKIADTIYNQNNDEIYTGDLNAEHSKTVSEEISAEQVSMQKLDEIVLVNKRFASEKYPNSNILWQQSTEQSQNTGTVDISELITIGTVNYYVPSYEKSFIPSYQGNILDASDNITDLLTCASKKIVFNYDYSIRAGYENNTIDNNTGKLTLTDIQTKRNNEDISPKTEFGYKDNLDSNQAPQLSFEHGWIQNGWGNLCSVRNALGSSEIIDYINLSINDNISTREYRLLPINYNTVERIKSNNEHGENKLISILYDFKNPVIPHKPRFRFNTSDFISLFYARPNPVLHFKQAEMINETGGQKTTKSIFYYCTPEIQWDNASPDQIPNILAVSASADSRSFKIKQSFSKIGRIEATEHYKYVNEDLQLIAQEFYKYANEESDYSFNSPLSSAGIVQESFTTRKLRTYTTDGVDTTLLLDQQAVISRIPSVLIQTTKNNNGDISSTEIDKFDLESGNPLGISAGGRKIISTPTYLITESGGQNPYNLLSGKYKTHNNKNIYSLASQSEVKESGDYFSMSIQMISDSWEYPSLNESINCFDYSVTNNSYKILKEYTWKGTTKNNGAYADFFEEGLDKRFDWTLTNLEDNEQNGWVSMSENIAYDEHSNLLESIDINGNYSSIKYDHNGLLPLSSGSNSAYLAYFHSSFENYEEKGSLTIYDRQLFTANNSGLRINDNSTAKGNFTSIQNLNAHTGEFYYCLQNTTLTYTASCEKFKPNSYNLIFWVNENSDENLQVNVQVIHSDQSTDNVLNYTYNSISNAYPEIEGWHYVKLTVDLSNIQPDDKLNISFNGESTSSIHYLDDIRFQPINSQVNAMVYDRKTNDVKAVLDNNNFATKYIYYPNGSLYQEYVESIKFGLSKFKEYDQHYLREE